MVSYFRASRSIMHSIERTNNRTEAAAGLQCSANEHALCGSEAAVRRNNDGDDCILTGLPQLY